MSNNVPACPRGQVAMAVGYLDPMPVERVRAARRQVLVVVTASWQVGAAGEATRCRVVKVALGVRQCHYHILLLVAMQLGAWMRRCLPGGPLFYLQGSYRVLLLLCTCRSCALTTT